MILSATVLHWTRTFQVNKVLQTGQPCSEPKQLRINSNTSLPFLSYNFPVTLSFELDAFYCARSSFFVLSFYYRMLFSSLYQDSGLDRAVFRGQIRLFRSQWAFFTNFKFISSTPSSSHEGRWSHLAFGSPRLETRSWYISWDLIITFVCPLSPQHKESLWLN